MVNSAAAKGADWITGSDFEVDEALRRLSSVIAEPNRHHQWVLRTTATYLAGPPTSYYWEPAFIEYEALLKRAALKSVSVAAHSLLEAAIRAERVAFRLENSPPNGSAETNLREYWGPVYLELCEQVLDVFLGSAADWIADSTATGRPSKCLVNIVEFLSARRFETAAEGYDAVVRNGLAHDLTFRSGFAGTQREAVFKDNRGNEAVRTPAEFVSDVQMLTDRALGYAFALRLYLLDRLHPKDSGSGGIEPELREWVATRWVSTNAMRVDSATVDVVRGKRQVTVHTTDLSKADNERRVHMLVVLRRIGELYPDAQQVFLGFKGHRRMPSWVTCKGRDLNRWVDGKLSDDAFGKALGPNLMLFPFGRPGSNLLFKWRMVAQHARRAWRARRPTPTYRIISTSDISTGLARRYRADIIIDSFKTVEDVERAISSAVRSLRRRRVHRDRVSANRWGSRRPHFVAIFAFSREKRSRDRWADPIADFYVARGVWRDPRFSGQLPMDDLPARTTDGVDYELGPNWADAGRSIPPDRQR